MSAFRLPRLPQDKAIVDNAGFPQTIFQRWWQSVMEKIEAAIADIRQLLIDVGIAQETADGGLALAQSGINPDGTIKDEKVVTESVVANGITERYFAQSLFDLVLPDGVETEVVTLTAEKIEAESEVDIDVAIRLASSDDIQGQIKIYRDADVIDSFEPFIKGAGDTLRLIFTMPLTESDTPVGEYEYKVTFTKDGGASALSALARSNIRIKEIKR